MYAWRLALASALCGLSLAAAATGNGMPAINSGGVVNAATGQPGLAPNSICAIYGVNLYPDGTAASSGSGQVPTNLGGVTVYFGLVHGGIFYISPNQINVLVPGSFVPGSTAVTVLRNGLASQAVPIVLQAVAPGLFAASSGFAVALHADGTSVTGDSPAVAGEIVLLYGTGFGRTQPEPADMSIPINAAPLVDLADFQVLLDGVPLDPSLVQYAGVAPFNAGLYQVNVRLPDNLAPTNPQIQVSLAGVVSPAGLSLITGPIAH